MLHPFFTLRTGGAPARLADAIGDWSTVRALNAIDDRRRGNAAEAASVCAAMEAAFPTVEREVRRAVIAVKRDLFNARSPKPAARALVKSALRPKDAETLDALTIAMADVVRRESELDAVYDAEIAAGRTALMDMCRFGNVAAAIELSNPLLASRLERLFDGGAGLGRKDVAALWLALASYALRASQKTSPQSSFGIVAAGEWRDGASTLASAAALPNQLRETITLRHGPIQHVLAPLLEQVATLNDDAMLEVNPTIGEDENRSRWIRVVSDEAVNDRTRGAKLAVASSAPNKAIAAILSIVRRSPDGTLSLGALRARLAPLMPPRRGDSLEPLLQRALEHQLIRVRPQPAQRDILVWARAVAGMCVADTAHRLRPAIAALGQAVETLANSPRFARAAALAAVESMFDAVADAAGAAQRASACRPIVHDDCVPDGAPLEADPAGIEEIMVGLRRVLRVACLFGGQLGHGATRFVARDHFLARYGTEGRCADVADFLAEVADRAAVHASDRMGRILSGGDDADSLAMFDPAASRDDATERRLRALSADLTDRLAALAADGLDRAVDVSLVDEFIAALPAAIRARRLSHCVNGQFVPVDGAVGFVVNQVYPGKSRMLSRFLPDTPSARDRVIAYQNAVARGGRHAAIPGVFGFNANLHPRIADHELTIAPFPPDRDDTEAVDIASLALRYDACTEEVYVVDADDRPLEPSYQGILMAGRLPPIHRTLDALSGSAEGMAPIWLAIARRMPGYRSTIIVIPRLTVGPIVLTRRTYVVPKSLFPDATIGGLAFFRSVRDWARHHGVPRRCFFHRRDDGGAMFRAAAAGALDERLRTLARKMTKPVYVDFHSPITVQVLRRNILAQDEDIVLVEALPDATMATARCGDEAVVSELSLELTIGGQA